MATPASQLITQSLFQQAEQESLRNFSCLLRLQVYLLSQIHGAIESRLLSRVCLMPQNTSKSKLSITSPSL